MAGVGWWSIAGVYWLDWILENGDVFVTIV